MNKWITKKEAAQMLRVSVQTVSAYVRQGKLKAVKRSPGKQGRVWISRESVEAVLKGDVND